MKQTADRDAPFRTDLFDLALLVMRLARRLKAAREGRGTRAGDDALANQAVEYLRRKGLISPLRSGPQGSDADKEIAE